jgi:ribulose-5-phosphate 4-epimerase/fuculose-1-phosphate aldolase
MCGRRRCSSRFAVRKRAVFAGGEPIVALAGYEIVPSNFKTIPVVSAALTVGSDEVEEMLPPLLENYKAAMVRGHGSFAVGQMLEEAYQWTSSLEASCKALFLRRLLAPQGRKEGTETW